MENASQTDEGLKPLAKIYSLIKEIISKANIYYNSQDKNEKDKSIILIKSIIESSFITELKSINDIIYTSLIAFLYYFLGNFNASNEDTKLCEEYYTKSINLFNSLPINVKIKFINYYQDIMNNLGIIHYNQGHIKKGLEHFAKAEQIYKIFFLNLSQNKKFNFTNELSLFMENLFNNDDNNILLYNYSTSDFEENKNKIEHNYTLTIFYFAQAFTKLNFRKKAILFCSTTLKRQIEYNEYDLKDAVNNCMNLSDFYLESQNFAQTEYLLKCALELIPKNLNEKKKLRASVQSQLGKYYLERLKLALLLRRKNAKISEEKNLYELLNKKHFEINVLKDIKFPEIKDVENLEEAKSLFRKGNTQLKRALNIFIMDGYVTEHIKISQTISQLYKYLIFFETDNARIYAMEDRRINILEPIVKTINHKVYVMQWQEISLELAEIFCEIFEANYEIFLKKKNKNEKKIEKMNSYAKKSIFYYEDIIGYIENEYNKETEKKLEDFITIITIKSNIARLYSKFIFLNDVKKRVEYLKKSLEIYQQVYKLLKGSKDIFGEKEELIENLKMCEEMIGMLPIKIDKVNKGEEFI